MIITLPLDLSSQFGLIRRGKCEIRKYKLSVCTVWLVSQWSSSLLSSLFTSRDQGQAAALQIWNFVVFAMTDQGGEAGVTRERSGEKYWRNRSALARFVEQGEERGDLATLLAQTDGWWKVSAILIETPRELRSTEHSRLPSDSDSDCTEIRLVVRGCRLHPIHCGNGGLVTSLYQWTGETRHHQHYQPPTQTGEHRARHHIMSLTSPTQSHL